MKNKRRNTVIFVLVMGLTVLSCSSGQLLSPTATHSASRPATATKVPVDTNTPKPTKTQAPTKPLPLAFLTDGSDSWQITSITFEDSATISSEKVDAADGLKYLKIIFNSPKHKLLPFPTEPNSTDPDYSQVYVGDSLGNTYNVVSDQVDLVTGQDGSTSYGDSALYFDNMPEDSTGLRLFFADLSPVEIKNPAATAAAPARTSVPPTETSNTKGNLFSEDFSSNENGWVTGEESTDGGSVKRTIADGKYTINMNSKQDYFYVLTPIPVFSGSNFGLSIEATLLEGTFLPGNMTLEISTRQMDGISGRQYNFILMDDGSSTLDLWPDDNYQNVSSLWTQDANPLFQLEKGITKAIAIVMDGPNISAFVDGEKIDAVTDATVSGAGVTSLGLCLYNPGDSVSIAFDNLKIDKLP